MQIHRLFEIVYILMDRKKITARELAERFEVSSRTIYRDLDILSGAGIPVYTSKGRDGGIEILDSYVLDRSTLSESEQGQILMALQSMAATGAAEGESKGVLSKLSSLFNKGKESYIEADFSRWSGADEDRAKFEQIQYALINRYVLSFAYHSSASTSSLRHVKPIKLVFRHSTWYLQAWCMQKADYRNFKLTRMADVAVTDESYYGEEFSPPPVEMLGKEIEKVSVELLFAKDVAYLVYDEFPSALIQEQADGFLRVSASLPMTEWLKPYILSFGSFVELIKPDFLREEIACDIRRTYEKYF